MFCKKHDITQSMSKAGCPYDNAPMERFYNTFKNELIYQNTYYNEESLDDAVNNYIFCGIITYVLIHIMED